MSSPRNSADRLLFALIDGAAGPERIHLLLEQCGAPFKSLFEDLPEAALGPASPFLVRIEDIDAAWVAELDRIDQHSPCLSLIWSRVGLNDLAMHLGAFLFAEIGEGQTALIRFYDPRNTEAMFRAWGEQIQAAFLAPMERWLCRGRHREWQRFENDSVTGSRICTSMRIQMGQADLDLLTEHTEPDELLTTLTEQGFVDAQQPYLERFGGFLPRYQRALQWGLAEPADRLRFCRHTYLHGQDFDQHAGIRHVLSERAKSGEPYGEVMKRVPEYVWEEVERKRNAANVPEGSKGGTA